MRLLRTASICAAALALILPQAAPAFQADQAAGAMTKTEKKVKSKAKKAAESTSEATDKSAATATEPAAGAVKGTENAAQSPGTQTTRKARTAGSAERAVATVSQSEIAAAKASGKVWVNTETGVYHKGGQWYGATKQGKFMTEEEATKAGYRASKSK